MSTEEFGVKGHNLLDRANPINLRPQVSENRGCDLDPCTSQRVQIKASDFNDSTANAFAELGRRDVEQSFSYPSIRPLGWSEPDLVTDAQHVSQRLR